MKNFEFFFEGTARNSDDTVRVGIKILSGDPLEIAHALGAYADGALKQLREPQAAVIVINAFKKFMELNPDMTEAVMKQLTFIDGPKIVRPTSQDIMGNINPLKSIKN